MLFTHNVSISYFVRFASVILSWRFFFDKNEIFLLVRKIFADYLCAFIILYACVKREREREREGGGGEVKENGTHTHGDHTLFFFNQKNS